MGECLQVSLLSHSSVINLWLLQPPSLLTPQTHTHQGCSSESLWLGGKSKSIPMQGAQMGLKNLGIWNGSVTKQLVTLDNASSAPWVS